ncbi:hypothetical protein [Methanomethylovorans sp.]|uniref:hypothetical protein n=1 Tax=Methanomethylovorans sp. TaxID=2758717 RepID=UPI00345EDF85
MNFARKRAYLIFGLIIFYNLLIRFQINMFEIGVDSFFVHVLVNSVSEFGFAKWYLNPLSFAGLYPYSYASSVPFLLSGFAQMSKISMNYIILIYCQIIGLLSIFTAYLMTSEIIDDKFTRIVSAFFFSISLSIVTYSTLTIPTRGLLIVLAPLVFYFLVKMHKTKKISYYILFSLLCLFMILTHHLFYFFLPLFASYIVIEIVQKFQIYKYINLDYIPYFILIGFIAMFSVPFFTGKFLETSRYAPLFTNYLRYVGIPLFYSIGGISYLVFKHEKKYSEYLLLLTIVFLTPFIYKLTYMKMFISAFLIPFAGYGFSNFTRCIFKQKRQAVVIVLSLLLITSFVSYYQFLNEYNFNDENVNERTLKLSSYSAGNWMKENTFGNAISNNDLLGVRISSVAETTHFVVMSSVIDQVYGFIEANISEFKMYPITSEDFWYSGYAGPDHGNEIWADIHRLVKYPDEFNITYVVEDINALGNVVWNHSPFRSKLITESHTNKGCVFDNGNIKIWKWE